MPITIGMFFTSDFLTILDSNFLVLEDGLGVLLLEDGSRLLLE